MKWYNGVMMLITWICVGIVLFALIGCANTQSMREAKDEQALREHVLKMPKGNDRDELLLETVDERSYKEEIIRCENYMTTENAGTPEATRVFDQDSCRMEEVQRVEATEIGMPKEWMDQWPSLREENNE